MMALDVWAVWLGALMADVGVPIVASARRRRVAASVAWEQAAILLGAALVGLLAVGTGLLVLMVLGRPDLRGWCLLPGAAALLFGAALAVLPLLRTRTLARRLGVGERDKTGPGPRR